jgi:hypothetical protein
MKLLQKQLLRFFYTFKNEIMHFKYFLSLIDYLNLQIAKYN